MTAVLLHAVVFALWIGLNTVAPAAWHYDAYPFQFLTMSVSLEAIFLSIFVLISENRQAASDRRVMELDARINRKAEQEIKEIRDDLQVIKRLLAKVVVE